MKRTDKYGGNFVNRVRFLKEIMEEVRKNVGPDFPVTVRFSAIEEAVGGRTMEESRPLAMLLEQWGADALHISASVYGNHINGIISSMYTPRAWLVDYAQEVKQLVKIPVFTVNHIADPFVAESILAAGKADIIGMGRESLAEPEFPNKAKAGDVENIRKIRRGTDRTSSARQDLQDPGRVLCEEIKWHQDPRVHGGRCSC